MSDIQQVSPHALETMKVSGVAQLVGLLTVGHVWSCDEERDLWFSAMRYLTKIGKMKGEGNPLLGSA